MKLVKATENFIIYISMVGWKIKLVATIATEASKAGKKAIVHLVSFMSHKLWHITLQHLVFQMSKNISSRAQTPFRSLFIPETTPIISKTSWILKFNVSLKWPLWPHLTFLTWFDLSVIVFLHFQFLDKMTLQFIPRSPSLLSVVSFIIRIQTNQLILTLFPAFSGKKIGNVPQIRNSRTVTVSELTDNKLFSGITLARWNPDDDVWMEHAKVSKELCGYLIYRKGLEYCEALRER